MRLSIKFTLSITFLVFISVGLALFFQVKKYTKDQEAYAKDLQTTFAILSEKRLSQKFNQLYKDLAQVQTAEAFGAVLTQWDGIKGAQWTRKKSRIPATENGWHFFSDTEGLLRATAAFSHSEAQFELDSDWFKEILEVSHVTFVQVLDAKGRILFGSERVSPIKLDNLDPGIALTRKVASEDRTYFSTVVRLTAAPNFILHFGAPWSSVEAAVLKTYRESASLAIAILFLSILVGLLLARSLARPLTELAEQTVEIAKGNFDTKLKIPQRRSDEVGRLARSFRRMGVELQNLRKDLSRKERLAAFGAMSAAIAHEIKNPLTSILGNTQLAKRELEKGNLPKLEDNLKFVESETLRANRTLQQLMKFARQEKVPEKSIDINGFIQVFLNGMALNDVRLIRNFPQNSIRCFIGEDQIQEVLSNLLGNAVHALKNSSRKEISISLREEGKKVCLSIEDTGEGMAPNVLEHIFEPFFTTKKIGEGTGLGLSVVHGIITSIGGSIEVKSALGQGSTFLIELPLAN